MAQQDYGAAQPIADWVNKYIVNPVTKVTELVNKLPNPPSKAPPSLEDYPEYRKAEEDSYKQATGKEDTGGKKLGQRKKAVKKTAKRKAAAKR